MKMSDAERLEVAIRALEETTELLRDLVWEVSGHRTVDREMQLIRDNEEIIGKGVAQGGGER